MPASVRILRSSSSAARAMPDGHGGHDGPGVVEGLHDPGKTLLHVDLRVAEQVVLGDAGIVEPDHRGVGGLDAELVLEPLDGDAGMFARHDERLDRRAAQRLVQRRPHHDVGGARTGGDEDLLAVDDVLVAVEGRRGGHRRRVGAETGLGDGHRGPHLAETFELFVGGHAGDRGVAEALVGHRQHQRHIAPADLESH